VRVAIYARISKASEDDTLGVDRQVALCRARVELQAGWTAVEAYVDNNRSAYSGAVLTKDGKSRREQYERMMAAAAAGEIDAILCYHADRLFRRDAERLRFYEVCRAAGVRHVFSVDGQDYDLETADGRRAFRDVGSAAEYASDRQGERLRAKHAEIAKGGRWSGGGRRPFGFRVVGANGKTRKDGGTAPFGLRLDQGEARIVRAAARSVLSGSSLYSVVQLWNDGRAPKDSGGRWTPTDVRRVLMSEQAAGLRGGEPAAWKPLIDADTHEALVAFLGNSQRRPLTEARQARRWALAGLVRCGSCGGRMDGRARTRKLRDGGKTVWRQYVCSSRAGGCGKIAIVAPDLERLVMRLALDQPEPEWPEERPQEPAVDPAVLRKLAELHERVRSFGPAAGLGLMTPTQVKDATDVAEAEIRALRGSIPRAEPQGPKTYIRTIGQFWDFMDGAVSEPPEAEGINDALRWVIREVRVQPARSRGVRFDPTRVRIATT
jgi:DNA invertase Pin-like site-specific DNA recombinase